MIQSKRNVFLTIGLVTALAALGATLFLPLAQNAYAIDYVVSDETSCESLPVTGGTVEWSAPNLCSLNGALLILTSTDTLTIASGVWLGGGSVENNGRIKNDGNFENDGLIINRGTFDNYGSYTDFGVVENYAVINNYGGMGQSSFAGGFENTASRIINNFGIITMNYIVNHGTINNRGVFQIFDFLDFNSNNSGVIHNYGEFSNGGFGGTDYYTNTGSIINHCGGTISGIIAVGNSVEYEVCEEKSFTITESGKVRVGHEKHRHTSNAELIITGDYECSINDRIKSIKDSLEGTITIDGTEYALSSIKLKSEDGMIIIKAKVGDGGRLEATLMLDEKSLSCEDALGTELTSIDSSLMAKIGKHSYSLIPKTATGSIEF